VLHDLEARGPPLPWLVISDGNPGLIKAIREVWPDMPRQRCICHRTRNILEKMPKSLHDEARKGLNRIWYAEDLDEAIAAAKAFTKRYAKQYKAAADQGGRPFSHGDLGPGGYLRDSLYRGRELARRGVGSHDGRQASASLRNTQDRSDCS